MKIYIVYQIQIGYGDEWRNDICAYSSEDEAYKATDKANAAALKIKTEYKDKDEDLLDMETDLVLAEAVMQATGWTENELDPTFVEWPTYYYEAVTYRQEGSAD